MSSRPRDLPDFKRPPLDEVVLSAQYDPLQRFQVPQIGLLWSKFRDNFPNTEQHPPLDPIIESFRPTIRPSVQLEVSSTPPIPRCWFLKEDGTELIQVQQDRFIHNWRKVGADDSYPRYEHVRNQFKRELETFCEFLATEKIGELSPTQCEVSYINVITLETDPIGHGEMGRILTSVQSKYTDDFLGQPENVRFASQYVFSDENENPLGRLHIAAKPAFRAPDGKPIFILNLTARGAPVGEAIPGVLRFMDMGREWIVRGFASITTKEMHKIWGRKDAFESSFTQ
jgi:uncharacterized protein (TIGR04255 family)